MKNPSFKVLFLLALPASGKSEVRNYLKSLSTADLETYGMGSLDFQLDDYPYVAMMRFVDELLIKEGRQPCFFGGPDLPFSNKDYWCVLNALIGQDYCDLVNYKFVVNPKSAVYYWLERFEQPCNDYVLISPYNALGLDLLGQFTAEYEAPARKMLNERMRHTLGSLEGATIVVEFARGGAVDDKLPLEFGYEAALASMPHQMLKDAAILYVYVTPEESRRKNIARGVPVDGAETGVASTMHHVVPTAVMNSDYSQDDILYLRRSSSFTDTVPLSFNNDVMFIPLGVFSNMPDVTTPLRGDKSTWLPEVKDAVAERMNPALHAIYEAFKQQHPE